MKYLLITLMILGMSPLFGQEMIPLWDGSPPLCPNDLTEESKLDPRIGRRIAKVQTPTLEAYFPRPGRANGASVIICPGGGYTILAYDWEGVDMAKWFNSMGVTAFVLKYRLPRYEEADECAEGIALADAQRAMRLVRSRTEEWNLDPERIGIMGFSAGGHLASTTGTHFDAGDKNATEAIEQQSSRPDFMILMYPVVSMDTSIAHMGSRRNLISKTPNPEKERLYSNEAQVTADTPPTLLIHADNDKGVVPENSVYFYLALRKAGVPAAMHIFATGGHGFSFGEGKGSVENWPDLCEGWLEDRGLLSAEK
ncbi:MAG: alpha/beta hydrolase [Bacteroidota bacterium]